MVKKKIIFSLELIDNAKKKFINLRCYISRNFNSNCNCFNNDDGMIYFL